MKSVALAMFVSAAGIASASTVTLTLNVPTGDRWNYPFAPGAGNELRIPTFSAVGAPGFDDRDAQALFFWDTDAVGNIASGLGVDQYRVVSARMTLQISTDVAFRYDPTADTYRNYLFPTDPQYIADADAGSPIELFGVGFRNQFQTQEFNENSPFPFGSQVEGSRNAYAAVFDAGGAATDVSNQVRDRFDVDAFAIGLTTSVVPGAYVPTETLFVFDVNTCDAGVQAYLARGLNAGRIYLTATSLAPAQGGPGGGTGGEYPDFITKEDSPSQAATLELVVKVGSPADIDGNDDVDFGDFLAFFNAFDLLDLDADINADCQVDFGDFLAFFNAFDAA